MPNKKVLLLTAIVVNGLFLFLDRWLKHLATHSWSRPNLAGHFFGWQPFLNPGIGFGIPVPNTLTLALTLAILAFVIYLMLVGQSDVNNHWKIFALSFIFTGAISNFIDRIIHGHTIDYLLVLTSIINIADVLIVVGFVLYLYQIIKRGVYKI